MVSGSSLNRRCHSDINVKASLLNPPLLWRRLLRTVFCHNRKQRFTKVTLLDMLPLSLEDTDFNPFWPDNY